MCLRKILDETPPETVTGWKWMHLSPEGGYRLGRYPYYRGPDVGEDGWFVDEKTETILMHDWTEYEPGFHVFAERDDGIKWALYQGLVGSFGLYQVECTDVHIVGETWTHKPPPSTDIDRRMKTYVCKRFRILEDA